MAKLQFEGKQHIYAHHMTVPVRALVPVAAKSVAPPGAASADGAAPPPDGNLIIHGDNLLALKSLLPRYEGRVNCIYIDPPYNTGNEGWVYNDKVNSPLMRGWLAENGPVDGEDLLRHDKWLCMMWPRLHLLHALLADDGVIFVSIDDNEQHHLRMLMDEIFGEENFVTNIVWQKKFSPQNDAKHFSDNHDFVVAYAKDKSLWRPNLLPRTDAHNQRFSNPDNDPRGAWSSSGLDVKTYMEDYDYPITTPSGRVVNPPGGSCWRYSKERFDELAADNRIWFGEKGGNVPRVKRFLSEVKQGITPLTVWLHTEVGHTQSATQWLNAMGIPFANPKPSTLLRKIFQVGASPDAIILDSFAGSGTTAEAVLALNKEDGGNRRFILVECEDYADTITAKRVRRVMQGVPGARDAALRDGLGGSFLYCELGGPIDVEAMLTAGPLPSYSALAAYLLFIATGRSAGEGSLAAQNVDGLFHSTDMADYYLLYEPDFEWLEGEDGMLRLSGAKRIQDELWRRANSDGPRRKAVVFGVGRYIKQDDLTPMGITFCQIPYETRRGA